jgi:hypothetical protein
VSLPHGGASLPKTKGSRALGEPQGAYPHGNGAAGHHHHLAARPAEARHTFDDVGQATERQLNPVVRDDVGAELDDDAVGIGEVATGF